MKCFLKSEKSGMKRLQEKYENTPLGDSSLRAAIRTAMFSQVSSEQNCQEFMDWMMSKQLSSSERGWGLSILQDLVFLNGARMQVKNYKELNTSYETSFV